MKAPLCRRTLALIVLTFALPLLSLAQESRGTLTGTVTDPNGAAVAGATVTVRNTTTNEDRVVTTSDDGNYTVPLLQPGTYGVSIEQPGFKKAASDNVVVETARTSTFDVALEVGGVEQTVDVTSEAPLLEPDSASRGAVIENMRVTELPLNGRNPLNLATLSPGVQFNGNPQFNRLFDNGDNVNFSINGGLNRHNEFLLDGTPNNAVTDVDAGRTRSVNNIAFVPPVDATEEFNVQTNAYNAEYGRTSGGVVNVSIKAGGPEFHGSLYEFARRYEWEANQFGNNARGIQKTGPCAGQDAFPRFVRDPITCENLGGHKQDQYGFVVSGPLLIPRFGEGGRVFLNGDNPKTFFLLNVEFFKGIDPAANLSDVPTLLERQGDFSQSGVTIYDPLTTRPDPANPGRFIRDPFPGNVIPADRINPVGQAIVNGFSLPNVGSPTLRFNNFLEPFPGTDDFHSVVTRVDHEFSQNLRMFFRYVHNRRDQIQQGDNGRVGLGIDPQDPLVRVNNGAVLDFVSILSPRSVLNVRVGFSRFLQAAFRSRSSPFEAQSLGFPESFSDARPVSIVPRIEFSGEPVRAFGPRNPNSNITNTWSFPVSLTHITGKHSLKFGGEYRRLQAHQGGGSFTWGGGFFRFAKDFTVRDPQNTSPGDQGSVIAALLLGYPSGDTRLENISPLTFDWNYMAAYVQDDFKVTPKLTLNLGLRYDYESPPVERYNRQNRGFGFDQASPLAAAVRAAPGASECPACANLTGGLLFAGVGQPDEAFRKDRNNFGPRFGLAYQLNEKTVFRGGYGLFYFPQAEFGGAAGFNVTTPFSATVGGGANAFIPVNTLSNPYPNGFLSPTGSSLGMATQLGTSLTIVDPDHVIPYVQQYSAGIQRELPWRLKLDVSYVGSRTRGILSGNDQAGGGRNINVLSAAQLAQLRQNPGFFTQQVPNPFAGLIPGNSALNAPTISRYQLLLPFPQFPGGPQAPANGSINVVGQNVGKLWYDSGQASLEKRFGSGLTMTASYTFSKQLGALQFLNPQDPEPTKAVTDIDSTHVFVVSGVYQLPFGKGKKFFTNAGRAANMLLGGWEYTWVGSFRSGRPLNLPTNAYLLKDPTLSDSSFDRYFNNCVLTINADGTTTMRQGVRVPGTTTTTFQNCTDPAWVVRNTNNTLGDIPLRLAHLREPWAPQFDMALNKTFVFTERLRFQLRFETFNTFNTPLFGSPNMNLTNNGFGILIPENSVRNSSNFRQVQLGGKFYF